MVHDGYWCRPWSVALRVDESVWRSMGRLGHLSYSWVTHGGPAVLGALSPQLRNVAALWGKGLEHQYQNIKWLRGDQFPMSLQYRKQSRNLTWESKLHPWVRKDFNSVSVIASIYGAVHVILCTAGSGFTGTVDHGQAHHQHQPSTNHAHWWKNPSFNYD